MKTAAFGTWESSVTAEMAAGAGGEINQVCLSDGEIVWAETRPQEGGRTAVARRTRGGILEELLPEPLSAVSKLAYGGGAIAYQHWTLYFIDAKDQCLYQRVATGEMMRITAPSNRLFADLQVDRTGSYILCVCEERIPDTVAPRTSIVSINVATGEVRDILHGRDFYSSPRLNRAGTELAWLEWDHPSMPWFGTELFVATVDLATGIIDEARRVAGNEHEAIAQPGWSLYTGELYFISDASGWWNLYRYDARADRVRPVLTWDADFTRAAWNFGMSTYAFVDASYVVATMYDGGQWKLVLVNLVHGEITNHLAPGLTEISEVRSDVDNGYIAVIGGSPTTAQTLFIAHGPRLDVLRQTARALSMDFLATSVPSLLAFPTGNGETAYAFSYPPRNAEFQGPAGEKPPVIVIAHGGPTSATKTTYRAAIQFWTNRGFAVIDVDYRGSTGYGRAYRDALDGKWGIVDVEDCVNAVRYAAEHGLCDLSRAIIRGGSAGGFTTLAALAFHDVFRAGACSYGIGDLTTLSNDTHWFESRYLDRLVAEEDRKARSPVHNMEGFNCPVIFFQGSEDKAVPPSQAEKMVAALRTKGIEADYVLFDGEGHGFKRRENMIRVLEEELAFYRRVFDLN